MPTTWCKHVPIHEALQSKSGDYYRSPNGNKIFHEGKRIVSMMTQECSMRDMRFTVCDVAKALGSMSQMCRTGHRLSLALRGMTRGHTLNKKLLGSECGYKKKEACMCSRQRSHQRINKPIESRTRILLGKQLLQDHEGGESDDRRTEGRIRRGLPQPNA